MPCPNPITGPVAVLVLALGACATPGGGEAYPSEDRTDPAAKVILAEMAAHLSGLKQFSVETQITLEDWLDSGHIADTDISTRVTVSRPNRIRSQRRGEFIDQDFYYDGNTLTLYNPIDRVYATVDAPPTIVGVLHYAHDRLGLVVPAADLIYPNAYPHLMRGVTHAAVVGKAVIGGVRCDHLLFVKPGLDFQVWVAEDGAPLPMKYVVTDTATPERLRVTTVLSRWQTTSPVSDSMFTFSPPPGVQRITFLPLLTTGDSR
jgi:hypothetical protein